MTLRPVAPHDHSALHALFTARGVRQFVFDDVIIPPEQTYEIITRSEALLASDGHGLWLAWPGGDRASQTPDRPIGFGGFWYFRDPPQLELLYGVADDRARSGYGREIARAMVDYGFSALNMPEIHASVDAPNVASLRLLDGLGFACHRREVVGGLDLVFYRLVAPPPSGSHEIG